MPDLKTTIAGLLTAVFGLLTYFHILVSPELGSLLIAICTGLVGYFAKDAKPPTP